MRARVYMPSGNQFDLDGDWVAPAYRADDDILLMGFVLNKPAKIHDTDIAKGEVMVLDPRSVVYEKGVGVFHEPADIPEGMMPLEFREWIAEHPEWPAILELEGA